MDTGVEMETEQQRMEREAKEKADADAANQGALPPPPMRPLMEQNFMQCMQNDARDPEQVHGRVAGASKSEGT